jgi:amino acid adenylation domain-containing protein
VPFELEDTEQSIPARFERQLQRHADRLAVDTDDARISYAELDRLSNGIAHAILAAGGASSEPVALLLDQGHTAVAAILGVLKAGKFYVALDPAHPSARSCAVMKDCGAALIATDARRAAQARELAGAEVAVLDLDALDTRLSRQRPDVVTDPDATACIFYTSGSTGQPKGVFDTHRNVLHNVMRYTNSLRIGPVDRLTLVQVCCFSGTVSSLFGALLNGACVLPFDLAASTPGRLADWLVRRRATIYHSVPTIFRSLFQVGSRSFESVRIVRLEGDTASQRDLDLFRRHFAERALLVNGLGATETGLVAQYFVDRNSRPESGVVPVGHPVADVQIRVVDEAGESVAANEVGEIAILSRYLAAGYWRRPDLTRERFHAAPHEGQGARIFYTGDMGRLRPDGCLEHLGRSGEREKIRGQMVELAEVEAALQALKEVKEAAVAVRESRGGERTLVGYVVPVEQPGPLPAALRRELASQLPAFMIPTRYVVLDALPQTSSAKIDRRALPDPARDARGAEADRGRRRNLVELRLTQIWQELLDLDGIGVTDDFFDLGGYSLLALEMLDRIEQELGAQLPPDCMLTGASIEHLGRLLEQDTQPAPIVELQGKGSAPAFYFLHGDYNSGGLYCRRLSQHLGCDQRVFLLTPCGLRGEGVPRSFVDMARVHVGHQRAHQPCGPYRLGGTCNGGQVALEMARELTAQGEQVERLVLISSSAANVRYRQLRASVDWLRWVGASADTRTTLYLRLRDLSQRLEGGSLLDGLAHLASKLGRVPAVVREVRQPGESAASWPDFEGLASIYLQLGAEYLPGPYQGRVALIAAADDPEPPQEMAEWWRRAGVEVELYVVPGTHDESLTRYAEDLAAQIRAALA